MGLELWNYFNRANLDSLKIAAVDLLLLASEEEHEFARAVGTRMLGSYLYQSGKIEQGLDYLNMARSYFEKKEDYVITSEIWNEIGHAYYLQGSHSKAKKAYLNSIRYGEKSTDATAAFNAKLGLGRAFIAEGDTNAGMTELHSYKQKSLESEKYEAAADVFAFMAMIEGQRGDSLLSQEYFDRSLSFSKRSGSKVHLAHSFANRGIRAFNAGNPDSSLYYFKKSLELRLEMKSMRPILEAYYNLGAFYFEVDSLEQSIKQFEIGREFSEKYEFWIDLKDFLDALIPIYEEQGKKDLVETYTIRKQEVEALISKKDNINDEVWNSINLDFTSDKGKGLEVTEKGGVSWIYFVLITLGVLVVAFLILERKRIN